MFIIAAEIQYFRVSDSTVYKLQQRIICIHLPTFYRPLLCNVHELHLFLVNFLHISEFNIEITYLLTHRLFGDGFITTNASPARCVLIKRKFGTPVVLKFRYTYICVTWLRHALRHDALRTPVSNNFVPITVGELGLGPLGG